MREGCKGMQYKPKSNFKKRLVFYSEKKVVLYSSAVIVVSESESIMCNNFKLS